MTAVISKLNESNYKTSFLIENSHNFPIMFWVLIFIVFVVLLYYLNKKLNFLYYIKEFFKKECAFCEKSIEKGKGIRKTVNVEGTLIKRNLSFCSEDHLKAYLEKYGEPIGCCANCMYDSKKYSFEWWIFWIKIVITLLFIIFIFIILLRELIFN